MEENPPPVLKKRATKRGLSKLISTPPDDQPEPLPHVTNVYSTCVQRCGMSVLNLPRKPLFSKQSNNDRPPSPDVQEVPDPPRQKRKTCTATATTVELLEPTILIDEDDLDEDENSMLSTDEVSIIRSPSPPVPPPPPVTKQAKPKRVSKGIRQAFKTLNSMKAELQKGMQASPKTPPVIIVDTPPVLNETQVVRVRHMDDVYRFSMAKTDMFYNLQTQMATLLDRDVEQIGLYLNDSRLGSSDTPQSTHLHLADIIVCHILVNKPGTSDSDEASSADCIRVQLQCSNSRQNCTMLIKKFLSLGTVMKKYADSKGRPLEKFQFHFDGEQLSPDTMPGDVDLDDDDTIDVVEMK